MSPEETMRCLGCGYDLRGLPEDRCPECGREFQADDADSVLTHLPDGRRALLYAFTAIALWFAFFGVGLWATRVMYLSGVTEALLLVFPFGSMLVATHAWTISYQSLRLAPDAVRHRWAFRVAMIVGVILGPILFAWIVLAMICGFFQSAWA